MYYDGRACSKKVIFNYIVVKKVNLLIVIMWGKHSVHTLQPLSSVGKSHSHIRLKSQ